MTEKIKREWAEICAKLNPNGKNVEVLRKMDENITVEKTREEMIDEIKNKICGAGSSGKLCNCDGSGKDCWIRHETDENLKRTYNRIRK